MATVGGICAKQHFCRRYWIALVEWTAGVWEGYINHQRHFILDYYPNLEMKW